MNLSPEQQDEITSLHAIFSAEEEIFDEDGGIMVLRIWRPMNDLPLTMITSSSSSSSGESSSDPATQPAATTLPTNELPFSLNFAMVDTYPTSTPPAISSISPHWLPSRFKAAIKAKLEEIYLSLPGEPVIYRWWEFLANEADLVSMLEDHLQSRSIDASSSSSSCIPLRGLLLEPSEVDTLQAMHQARQERLFARGMHPCGVCLTEYCGRDMVRGSGSCLHPFCRSCLAEFCGMHIREGSVRSLTCPEPSCGAQLSPNTVIALVGPKDAERYEQFMIQRALDSMRDIAYCPRTSCNTPVVLESPDLGMCPACLYSFCPRCEMASHGVEVCPVLLATGTPDREDSRAAKKKGDELKQETEGELHVSQRRALINKIMLHETLQKTTMMCPSCNVPIEKNGGCNRGCFSFPSILLWFFLIFFATPRRHVLHELQKALPLDRCHSAQPVPSVPP